MGKSKFETSEKNAWSDVCVVWIIVMLMRKKHSRKRENNIVFFENICKNSLLNTFLFKIDVFPLICIDKNGKWDFDESQQKYC